MKMLIDGYIMEDTDGYTYQYLLKSDIKTLVREILDLREEKINLEKCIDNWQAIWFFTLMISFFICLGFWIMWG
jgi:hypothetical protein